nr:hypothetical protein Iba_scaffold835263CG0010 [Ipomoea batatas]
MNSRSAATSGQRWSVGIGSTATASTTHGFRQQHPLSSLSSVSRRRGKTGAATLWTDSGGGALRRSSGGAAHQRIASIKLPPWDSAVVRGCGGSERSACSRGEGGDDMVLSLLPAVQGGGRAQRRISFR